MAYLSISGANSYWVREQAASWWDKKHQRCKHLGIRLIGNQQSKLYLRPADQNPWLWSCCELLNQCDSISPSWLRQRWRCWCRHFFFLNIWSGLMQLNLVNLDLRLTFRTSTTIVSLLRQSILNYPVELLGESTRPRHCIKQHREQLLAEQQAC